MLRRFAEEALSGGGVDEWGETSGGAGFSPGWEPGARQAVQYRGAGSAEGGVCEPAEFGEGGERRINR